MNKLTNWLLNRYQKDAKEKYDLMVIDEWEDELDKFRKLFSQKTIREILWEMVFTYDIAPPVNLKERYKIYKKLNSDKDFFKLFKSKYSTNYKAFFMAKTDEEKWILKGRMLELLDTLNTMDIAKGKLDNWDEVEKINSKKITLKKDLQEKFLTN